MTPRQTGRRLTPRDMIERLIAFDTVSRHSNLELIAFVEEYLSDWGIASRRVTNEDGTKASLFATLGPAEKPGGIVLSGHTDVVPVDGQDWSGDPFKVVEREDRLYGRGTCDMKSFIAIALAFVPDFLERGLRLPVHFALSYDEEVGCLGVRPMIDEVIRQLPRPEVVIVGEPTEMKVVNAHKGIHAFETRVTGLEAHSSATDKGVSAIIYAAELIHFLAGIGEEMKQRGDPSGKFEPPFTSVQIATIKGGTAINIVPRRCSFEWEFRALPSQDTEEIPSRLAAFAEEELLPRMRAVFPDAAIETVPHHVVPPLRPADGAPGETLVLQLAERNETAAVSFGTEAGLFQLADIPTVVCGPGSITQAHKPDEFIELEQVAACERFFRRLVEHVAG